MSCEHFLKMHGPPQTNQFLERTPQNVTHRMHDVTLLMVKKIDIHFDICYWYWSVIIERSALNELSKKTNAVTLPAKSMEYFEAQWKHSYLAFWFAGNGLAPTTTKYCHFNSFLMHSVRGEKYKLQCPKLKLHKIIYGDLSFFNTSHKISHSFDGIRHYIVNLCECYVCSVIYY